MSDGQRLLRPVAEMPAMAEYGVTVEQWTPLLWEWAAHRLTVARNFWLSTVGPHGVPAASPVWGVWDDTTLQFAFGCAATSRKARHLAANPRVVVAPEDTVEALSVQGVATLEAGDTVVDPWIDRFVAKYGAEVGPDYADFMRGHPLFVVRPTSAYGVIERADEFHLRATRWRFPE